MENIGRAEAKQISEAIREALKPVAEELGVDIEVGGGTFDPTVGTFKPKIEVSVGNAAENEFALNAPLFGLKAEDYGREFRYGGKTYRLVALSTRRPKYPVAGEAGNGKRYKFQASVLEQLREAKAS